MKDHFNNNNDFGPIRPADGLRLVSRCPVCSKEHQPLDTSLVAEHEGSHLIYITCRHCQSGVVAVLEPTSFGFSSLGVVTDLNFEEIKNLSSTNPVSADDVLGVFEYLKGKKK